ncbi:MAG: MBL fold metallo-hydrolase [Bacteroidales bacterium]|nr:MBL fold metallo-hydrolase [Bacteroidales bacterium]
MQVKCFTNNPFQENTYLLYDTSTRQCVIIDPGMCNEKEWQEIDCFITNERLSPVRILLTHGHLDHVMGTGYLAEKYGLQPEGPVEDIERLPAPEMQCRMFGIGYHKKPAVVSNNIKEGDVIHVGETEIQVLDVPGHSYHGLCYYLPQEQMLFSGDVLFFCSVGRSDFGTEMGCNGETLIDGIRCKLFALPPLTKVYPGHGPMTSIAQEIQCNPYV